MIRLPALYHNHIATSEAIINRFAGGFFVSATSAIEQESFMGEKLQQLLESLSVADLEKLTEATRRLLAEKNGGGK